MTGEIGSDLRHTFRVLAKSPGFSTVAVLSLAIGIGANTAMFGVVSTLLMSPLPVESPDELAIVAWRHDGRARFGSYGSTNYEDPDGGPNYRSNFSFPTYRALREAAPAGAELFAFAFIRGASVALAEQPAFLAAATLADGHYFTVLGPRVQLGRALTVADDVPEAPVVVVVSHAFWMRVFGGDPEVLGRTLRVNGVTAELVGVTAEGFRGLSLGGFFPQTDITVPLAAQPRVFPRLASTDESLFTSEDAFWLRLMARVSDGLEPTAVGDALKSVFRGQPGPLAAAEGEVRLRLLSGSQGAQPVSSDRARLLWFLMGVVGIVLLIACLNLASLMLARGASRQRETAVRRALGAGRARLVRNVLLESLVLSSVGSLLGLALVVASRTLLGGLVTGSLGAGASGDLEMGIAVDPAVLAMTALTGVAATLFFGLFPALRLSGIDPAPWLTSRAGPSANPRLTVGRTLVAVQVGISLPLVVGAGLFLRTVANLGAGELGFDPTGLASFPIDPSFTNRPPEDHAQLYQEVLASLQEVPGVRSVSLMENILLSGLVSNGTITVDDRQVLLYRNAIGPALLETMGMRLIEGRMPGLQDGPDAPPIGVVNETGARELFGDGSPVGRTLDLGEGPDVQVVGVVNDTPYRNRRSDAPATLYESALQRDGYRGHNVILRTDVPVARLETAIRDAVFRVDADLPVPRIRSQEDFVVESTGRERVFTQLLTVFGGFALFLAAIGLHGVTSYSVTRRTSEIGVRVAVGARPEQILWMILRQVVVLALAGLVVGIPIAFWAAPVVGSLLYGVAPNDAPTMVVGAVLMVAVAAGAGIVPALRAARMDTTVALGME